MRPKLLIAQKAVSAQNEDSELLSAKKWEFKAPDTAPQKDVTCPKDAMRPNVLARDMCPKQLGAQWRPPISAQKVFTPVTRARKLLSARF